MNDAQATINEWIKYQEWTANKFTGIEQMFDIQAQSDEEVIKSLYNANEHKYSKKMYIEYRLNRKVKINTN